MTHAAQASRLPRLLPVRHVILPEHHVRDAMPLPRETVARFLRRTGWAFTLPTICVIDGTPVLRRDRGWARRRIRAGEQVQFLSRPLGGSGGSTGKSIIGIVAMIALSALAPGIGTALGGGLLGALGSAAFVAAGGMLINTLISPKTSNKSDDTTKTLYQFGPQSNSARLREALPVQYGRIRKSPDFAALPWTDLIGDDQYIHVLLVDGEGRYAREQIEVGGTVLWTATGGVSDAFEGVEVAFYDPYQPVTLFPTNIASSAEVSGQELAESDEWVGTYVTNASGTRCNRLAFDFSLPAGLYSTNSKGQRGNYLSEVYVEIRPVNDLGAVTGGWTQVVHEVRQAASKQPFRYTVLVDVAPGRYQARARRGIPTSYPIEHQDTIAWIGMRAYLIDAPPSYPVSTTAIRMKATSQLTNTSATQFRTTSTRILRVWTGTAWVEQPTRRPAWAELDIATNDVYGCGLPLTDTDVQAIVDLAAVNDAKNETFDYEFRSVVQATDALDTPLRVCRARHRWLGSTLSLVREGWRSVPAQLLTDREIVRGSLTIKYQLQPEDAADAIIAEYQDETTWETAEVQVPPDITPLRPTYVQWPGAVQRAQVASLTNFLWQQHTRRRVLPTLSTERDGRMLSYGDAISLQSDLPQEWGAAAAIVGRSGNMLSFDRPLAWGEGQSYVRIRMRNGKQFGPVKIARGSGDALGVLDAADLALVEAQQGVTLTAALVRRDSAELPSCAVGTGTATEIRALVLRGRPSGNRVQLELVVDYPEVHDDGPDPGPVPAAPSLSDPSAPQVAWLHATLEQNVMEPLLQATWAPAPGAYSYTAQISYDGRVTWQTIGSFTAPSLSVVVQPAALSLRVQAVGREAGAWAVTDLEAPTIEAVKIDTGDLREGLKDLVTRQMALASDEIEAARAGLALVQAEMAATLGLQQLQQITTLQVMASQWRAEVSTQITAAVGPDSALAQQITDIVAQSDTISARVQVAWTASAAPAGAISAIEMTTVAGNKAAGLRIISTETSAYMEFRADKAVFASPTGTQMLLLDTSSGGNVYLNGALYAPHSIQAGHLAANSVETNSLTIGGVTTDRVAWAAINNVISERRTDTLDSASNLLWPGINRTGGTVCNIRGQIYIGEWGGSGFTLPDDLNRLVVIRRWSGGSYSDIYVTPYRVPPVSAYVYNSYWYYIYGRCLMTFDFLDTDNLSGPYSYELLLLTSGWGYTPWPGKIGERSCILQEIKR